MTEKEEYVKPKWGTFKAHPPGASEGAMPWTGTSCQVGEKTYEYMVGHNFIYDGGHYDLWIHSPGKPTEHTYCNTSSHANSVITEAIESYNKKHGK